MLTRFYQASPLDLQHLAQSLGDTQQMIVQIKKESVIRFLMGLNKAIGVTIEQDTIDRLIHEQQPDVQGSDAPKGV